VVDHHYQWTGEITDCTLSF